MTYNLLVGGYRSTIATLSFDPASAKLKVVAESKAPKAASWLEPSRFPNVVYTLSEDEKAGKVVSLNVDAEGVKVGVVRDTDVGPAHLHHMKDGSGVVVSHYVGGSVAFYPTDSKGHLVESSESSVHRFEFPYANTKAPNPERQDTPHAHQVIEGEGGKLYCMDLGSDRIWVLKRSGESGLEVEGWLQCPGGSGPRHAVISPDGKLLYVLTEMGHALLVFTLDGKYPAHPLPDFEIGIIPSNVPKEYQTYMDSSEICYNPSIPDVIYASNRWELHINEKLKENKVDLPEYKDTPSGDAVAIILLSGGKVEKVDWVRTGCDAIRGMKISQDGKFAALAGQEGGGVEIWKIEGERGDDWKLAAKKESLEQVTDLLWL